jgi:hypothetical protein
MAQELKGNAEEFFNKLQSSKELQAKIKEGIEKLAKDNGYDVTEKQLTDELRKRWQCHGGEQFSYSEPPGF